MDIKKILSLTDHTNLAQNADEGDIARLIDEAEEYGCASVCIPPSLVKFGAGYRKTAKICTVIGFPNGYNTKEVKCYETECAIEAGADEIDMVINLALVKMGRYDEILDEINAVKASCHGRLLKVIIETCLLSYDEKVRLCEVVSKSDAEFIKTSTGFSSGGATAEDVALLRKHCLGKSVKAAGGIKTLCDAEEFVSLGADRLGSSRIVRLVKETEVR